MKKFYLTLIIGLFLFSFLTNPAAATLTADFKNQEAPSEYIYPQEFDNLVMDLIIPSGINGEDKLKAITLENVGTTTNLNDIEKIKLWSDAGPVGFQGMEVDKELGTFTFYGLNNSWYLNNLNESVPAEGLRIFISADITRGTTASKTIQMRIPLLNDVNSNSIFDLGDSGVFMESKNNGPTDKEIINSYSQEIRKFVGTENLAPKSVIIDPKDGATLTAGNSYTIKGVARDQGGSTPAWVQLGINNTWYDVIATGSNYLTWEYNWQDIKEGTYRLKTKSADWIGNTEDPRDGGVITVIKETPVVQPPSEEPPVLPPPAEKPISEMSVEELKAKITEIQQKIVELLTQLIQILQTQINALEK